VDAVLKDVDWRTLVFLGAIFVLIQAFTKTGLLQGLSVQRYNWFGSEVTLVQLAKGALLLLALTALMG
jgi:Na+/H+ antiporter NhaD/arsenite permease-like protein